MESRDFLLLREFSGQSQLRPGERSALEYVMRIRDELVARQTDLAVAKLLPALQRSCI